MVVSLQWPKNRPLYEELHYVHSIRYWLSSTKPRCGSSINVNLRLISFQHSQLFSKHSLVAIQNIMWKLYTLHLLNSLQIQPDTLSFILHLNLKHSKYTQRFSWIGAQSCLTLLQLPARTIFLVHTLQYQWYHCFCATPLWGVFHPEPPPLLPVYYTLHASDKQYWGYS